MSSSTGRFTPSPCRVTEADRTVAVIGLLFAVPAFGARDPADVLAVRAVGILGYTLVFGATCVPLARHFAGRLRAPVAPVP